MNTDGVIQDIFLKNKTIAVYGMSTNPDKPSHYVPVFLRMKGFDIIPIHPSAETIAEHRCYPRIDDVEQKIDVLEVFRPSEEVLGVVKEAIKRRDERGDIAVIWLQLGIENDEAKRIAEEAGIIFIQNKCMKAEYQRLQSK